MFPTPEEKQRAQKTDENYALFRGKWGEVLRYFRTYKERRNTLEVVENLAGDITRVFADLMFLKPPKVTIDDPALSERIADFFERSRLSQVLHESALTQSYNGRTTFEMRLDEGLAIVEELDPATVFPHYKNSSFRGEPVDVVISWEPKIDGKKYRFLKTHTVGQIRYQLLNIDDGGKAQGTAPLSLFDPDLMEIEETGLDYIPVYFIDNQKTGRDMFGISDYDDLRLMFEEISRTLSQAATQFKKNATAKMAVPPGVIDDKGQVISGNDEFFEIPASDGEKQIIPSYITNNNALMEWLLKWADDITMRILRTAEVADVLIGLNTSRGAEAPGALALRIMRTLAKVQRKLWAYNAMLKEMIIDAMIWEKSGTVISAKNISLTFSNGLPEDRLQNAQIQSTRYTAGLQSLKDAIRDLDGLEGDALDAKVEEINSEHKAAAPVTSPFAPFAPIGTKTPVTALNK